MIFRFSISLIVLGVTLLPLSASAVTSCGIQPPGQRCTQVTTSLTPYPTITAEASATDAVAMAGGGFAGGPIGGLTFNFEVIGPPTTAVLVDVGLSGVFGMPGGLGFGWSCNSGSNLPYAYQCSGAEIISPGWYLTDIITGGPAPPLQTGSIAVPVPWIVPNEWNQATIGAGAGVFALAPGVSVSLESSSTTSMQLVIDPSFPDAADYQIVIAPEPVPEPKSAVLVAAGFFVLGFIRSPVRRWPRHTI